MKNFFKTFIFIILAFFAFGSAWFFDKGIKFFDIPYESMGFDIKDVQTIVSRKEQEMNQFLDSVQHLIKQNNFKELAEPNTRNRKQFPSIFSQPMFDNLNEKGYVILIYKDKELKYWSDINVPIDDIYPTIFAESKFIYIGNRYYIVDKRWEAGNLITGLILVKNVFNSENEFLKSYFHEEFDLESSVEISLTDSLSQNSVFDSKKEFLFSLQATYNSITEKPFFNWSVLLYVLGIFLFLWQLRYIFFQKFRTSLRLYQNLFLVFLILVLVRTLMLYFKIPSNFYALELFQPHIYASSFILPSLGDLMIHVVFFLWFVYILTKVTSSNNWKLPKDDKKKNLFSWISTGMLVWTFILVQYLIYNLLVNSQIPFETYKLLNLNLKSLYGYIIIALLFGSFLLLSNRILGIACEALKLSKYLTILFIQFTPVFVLYFFVSWISWYSLLLFVAVVFIIIYTQFKMRYFMFFTQFFVIVCLSFFIVAYVTQTLLHEEVSIRQAKAAKLLAEPDRIAEHYLSDIDEAINNDTLLRKRLLNPILNPLDEASLKQYLQKKYFYGYWRKYSLTVEICGQSDKSTISKDIIKCVDYFSNQVKAKGNKLTNCSYYYLDNMDGTSSYFGFHQYVENDRLMAIILKLTSKNSSEELVYPKLLVDYKTDKDIISDDYSYAKYKNGILIKRVGKYEYSHNFTKFHKYIKGDKAFVDLDNNNHMIIRTENDGYLVVSRPHMRLIDIMISFSYNFVFLSSIFGLFMLIRQFKYLRTKILATDTDFKNRIIFSMIIVLFLSFLLVGGGTVWYDIKKFTNNYSDDISEKINSVRLELEQEIGFEERINAMWYSEKYSNLNDLLLRISSIFYASINLYDLNGVMIASSHTEVFDRLIIGKKLNTQAYKALIVEESPKFIHDENIGNINYLSAYAPFTNDNNIILGYVNLVYLAKPMLLRSEISNLIITMVNLYVVLFLISFMVAVFMSEKITQPLRMLSNKFKGIQLVKTNEHIIYEKNDEIGSLVKEYNRMVDELEKNIGLLAKSERESAWREMAKQVAHEIKNPLTPMKLSIQYLQRMWKPNTTPESIQFGKKLEGVCKTLIEQIDNLSVIASEFSNFAKMPAPVNEETDLIPILQNCVRLFENEVDAKVKLDIVTLKTAKIFADREQLLRAFINIVKNGIQSIPKENDGLVSVKLIDYSDFWLVEVEDNGSGIPDQIKDKLFTPSFTTKSSGMGIGLSIVKTIIENTGGSIWFETELQKGTKFLIKLPKFKED